METPIETLRRQAELLSILSTRHLMPATFVAWADDELSINARAPCL